MITKVLSGSKGLRGLDVELRVTSTTGVNDGGEQRAARGASAFRAVPLLRVVGTAPDRVLVVGQARVVVRESSVVVELALQAAWQETPEWVPVQDAIEVGLDVLAPALQSPSHDLSRTDPADLQAVAALVAKALAEGSRNAVADVRAIRYELEAALATGLREKGGRTGLLSQIVEIALAVNRARDQAREAAREGMWMWVTGGEADDAYQQHRRALDPTLLNGAASVDLVLRPWMRQHDAGYRQCAGMEGLLGEEARLLYDLLGGASTVEASREADAQEKLNTLLTVAGVGLGLPALLLTLYGVEGLTPVNSAQGVVAVGFIAVVTLLAATLPAVVTRRQRPVRRWIALAAAVVGLVALLVLAGLAAPASP